MKKKKFKEKPPTGNDIQIKYETYLGDSRYLSQTLRLRAVALDFQSATDEWQGAWNEEPIWAKFTRPGWEITFSDNFPSEHKRAAEDEVRRIERQFN